MAIYPEFETLIVCRHIIETKFNGGWANWIEKYSMEDDGLLSRVSAMSGSDIARTEKRLLRLGLMCPQTQSGKYQYTDYFIYGFEYKPHEILGLQVGFPSWLEINFPEIVEIGLGGLENLPPEEQGKAFKPSFTFNKGYKLS